MSDETPAVDGANPAAPVEAVATPATDSQETSAAPAEAEQGKDQERDPDGKFAKPAAQERINDLTRKWRSTERERDELAQRLHHMESQRPAAVASEKAPALEDFTDINEWSHAVVAHAERKAQAAVDGRFSQQTQQTSQQQLAEKFATREREYAAANPNYIEAVQGLGSVVQFSPEQLEVIGSSDHGPALVHHLANHLDEAVRISRMAPHMAAAELARLEARVSAPKAKPVTNAPAPVPTVGGGTAPVSKNPDDMTSAEWLAWRNKQLKK